jgi:7,8-dihydropterin-6-yl-methyl-4-(beta-D-ribofuranosyl)aminobenzene 5'-phosphate synthase
VNGVSSTLFFDYGMDLMGMTHNIEVLGIDVGRVNAMALSHGHFDHWVGSQSFSDGMGIVSQKALRFTSVRKPLHAGFLFVHQTMSPWI